MILNVLRTSWPLFLGIAFLMLGNGLQGTLISWRATYEGFNPSTTGLIMAGYYAGFLAGSMITPGLVRSVGYIRVFAALASLASTAVLFQVLYIDPINWFAMRLITGFCFAGSYVIAESWLNASSNNETRGQTLSFYMLISYGGLAGGQWLLNLAPPSGFSLFLLASILLSLALIPLLIRRTVVPDSEDGENLGIMELIKSSPAGMFSVFVGSSAHGAMFAMGAVFAVKVGMTVSETALFMSTFIAMGAIAQWPLGWLSDRIDRRIVLMGSGLIASALCVVLSRLEPSSTPFFFVFAALGAISLPIYSIAVAQTNDRLKPEQMTDASSTIVLVAGIGSIFGPVLAGYLLNKLDAMGYLLYLGLTHFIIAIGVTIFMLRRKAVPSEEQTQYQAVPPRLTGVGMEAVAMNAEDSIESDTSDENE